MLRTIQLKLKEAIRLNYKMSIKYKLPDERKREPIRRRGITKKFSIDYKRILTEATKTLKNNFCFRYTNIKSIPKKKLQDYKDFMIGIYNRFDEIGLLYSRFENISFNKAIIELKLEDYMTKLKGIISSKP